MLDSSVFKKEYLLFSWRKLGSIPSTTQYRIAGITGATMGSHSCSVHFSCASKEESEDPIKTSSMFNEAKIPNALI